MYTKNLITIIKAIIHQLSSSFLLSTCTHKHTCILKYCIVTCTLYNLYNNYPPLFLLSILNMHMHNTYALRYCIHVVTCTLYNILSILILSSSFPAINSQHAHAQYIHLKVLYTCSYMHSI